MREGKGKNARELSPFYHWIVLVVVFFITRNQLELFWNLSMKRIGSQK